MADKFIQIKFFFLLLASCELGCFIAQTGHGYNFGNVADGTNCDQMDDGIFSDKCINGQCVVSSFFKNNSYKLFSKANFLVKQTFAVEMI